MRTVLFNKLVMELESTGSPRQQEHRPFPLNSCLALRELIAPSSPFAVNVVGKCGQTDWNQPKDSGQLVKGQEVHERKHQVVLEH